MFRLLVVIGLAASALSQCPPAPECSGCDESSEHDDVDGTYCHPVNTINRTVHDLAMDQPLYYTFLPNSADNKQLDHVCVTMFPLHNETGRYILYSSHVYIDGSVLIKTYIAKTSGTGVNVWAQPEKTFSNYVLGYADCGTYVKYRCGDCGDTNGMPFVFGMVPYHNSSANMPPPMLSLACQRQAFNIADTQGLRVHDMYVLPNKLPSRCVYQQRCQARDSPVYCQEQGGCQPY